MNRKKLFGKISVSSTSQILVLQPKHTNKINRNLVPTTSTQVGVNDVKIEIALWGCRLQGKVPYSTIYSGVKAAREKETYNEEIRRAEQKKVGSVIERTTKVPPQGISCQSP